MPAARPLDTVIEHCSTCTEETAHEIAIEFRSESPDPAHAGPSRQPYRRSTCRRCGERSSLKVNDV